MVGVYGGTLVAFAAQASKLHGQRASSANKANTMKMRQPPLETSAKKFSGTKYKIFNSLELFFSPHLSVGKVNSLLWKLHFGGLLRVILVARQKWVFLRSRLP
jgi:hypothetical protein